ncbi:MAG: phosphoenolpyruvate--protein phosphotransferase [Melioribacteraceae bacterium]|nr:phosphoenolpyruvate--protein phosphotransferase [Melioribacteraceae bacterium]
MKHDKSNILHGLAAAPGLAIAVAHLYTKEEIKVIPEDITDIDEALNSLHQALEKSKKELRKVFDLAVDKLGENRAAIFEAQLMILDDPILIKQIEDRIRNEKKSPDFIVDDEISKYQKMMRRSSETYLKERSHDIEDIKQRIIRNIKKRKWISRIENDVNVVAPLLTPADSVLFSRVNVKGYVTDHGGLTSHAAIVARSLNIPAVVGLHDATAKIRNGDLIIVDGFHGNVIINPDNDQLNYFKERIEKLSLLDSELSALKDLPAETLDGRKIKLLANLDLQDEIDLVMQNGAEGIGLVRTEQIFQEHDIFPEEEEQFKIYKGLAEKLFPNDVTIRTLDIGGDKVLPVDVQEPNPFLGWRGVRLLLDNKNLFKKQIRAILRSSIHRNVKMMIPMIASIREIRESKKLIEECKQELRNENLQFDEEIKIGIMIEVPSAAVMAKEYADEVSFFSIGTNDLIQYLLAVDRGNDIISNLYQEFHPAVVRTLNHIITEGKSGGVEITICGEMAADLIAIPLLVGLGLDAISVSPSAIPFLKRLIRNLNYSEAKRLADECLKLRTEPEINHKLKSFYESKLLDVTKNIFN